jgi:putative methionine-R-sulfoxide reductase with GAF domain
MGPMAMSGVTGNLGICKINPATLEIDDLKNTPLTKFDSMYVNPILFTDPDNLWIATNTKGVFHYTLSTGQLINYNVNNGLIWNGIFCLGADNDKNMYVGTPKGLNIIFTNGRIKTLTKKDGLLIDRAEGLLLDKHNRMWIGNDIGLACYTPADSSLITFDTRYGLSIYGFRVSSYFQTPNGEFAFGTPRGIQYFHPDSLYNRKFTFSTLIHKIVTKDIDSYISESDTFRLSPSDRQVTFYFSTIDYSAEVRTYYEYKLSGIDEDWIKVVDQYAVRYNSLPSGEFVFQVRVSNDNKHWQNAENQVTLLVAAHFYQMWWFQVTALLLFGWIIYKIVNRNRKKQQLQREELETEVVIHYFASQINQQKEIEAVLWDVAKNCISRLNLEECVIYLVDRERQVLVQKAAYGPKTAKDHVILQPIDIPLGQGISGSVTLTKRPEIVNNTEKDSRYIVDDERRLSEMAVPIIVNNEVIGVIDSENSQRNFFTPKHLSLMTTISILTANQIQRILTEEEKQKAEIEVLQNKQKATESRLQSLRLQMNPHFLFNALNSIQQMILANEEMVATRYLSRFSKLLRSILIHSDKEMISLKEELDILKLYVELESVRFKEAFSYQIDCDEDIDVDEVKIPTLLIQPFVENAIWHGLMHKEGMRNLKISFAEQGDVIQCIVEDNGIGRQKAKEMKISTGSDKKHTSKGIEVSMERLKTMKKNGGPPGTMYIHDLVDAQGNPTGTRIEINLPIQN